MCIRDSACGADDALNHAIATLWFDRQVEPTLLAIEGDPHLLADRRARVDGASLERNEQVRVLGEKQLVIGPANNVLDAHAGRIVLHPKVTKVWTRLLEEND